MKKFDSGTDWTFEDIDRCYNIQKQIVDENYQLYHYPNQIEIISSEQMLEAYTNVGMPMMYDHWSFGKKFVQESAAYRRGHMGLAYEIVINTNPSIAYLMEENTMCMQALVIAHASFGHNSFFANNNVFKQWTDASAIVEYLTFAKNYVSECYERYGNEVTRVIDAAHALQHHGVDRYRRPRKLAKGVERQRLLDREEYDRQHYNDIWKTVPTKNITDGDVYPKDRFPKEPEENLLYFLEKHAPNLDDWKREILRIVRKISQYFYPQMLTKIMNEGWATFTHHNVLHDMCDRGYVTDGFMLEFLASHSSVVYQAPYKRRINPYALGVAMFQDIKRVSMSPTKEDEKWFKADWVGNGKWLDNCKYAMQNFKDESFIYQYLSPKLIRDFKLMSVYDDTAVDYLIVDAIHDDEGYEMIRENLAESQNVNNLLPDIQIVNVDVRGDRTLELYHYSRKGSTLDIDSAEHTLEHLAYLWEYPIVLTTVDEEHLAVNVFEVDY